jgi:hypothetical protein
VIKLKDNKLIELSMNFSVDILKAFEEIKGHYSLINQLERSAASINIAKNKKQ